MIQSCRLSLTYLSVQDNWIFGANIAGKKRCLRFFFGGMQAYNEKLEECKRNGYAGFKPFADRHDSPTETEQQSFL